MLNWTLTFWKSDRVYRMNSFIEYPSQRVTYRLVERPVLPHLLLSVFSLLFTLLPPPLYSQVATAQETQAGLERPVASSWHYQFTLFHYLLNRHGLKTLTNLKEVSDSPERSVVLVLGQQDSVFLQREIQPLVGRAAILIASDYASNFPNFFQIAQGPVTTTSENLAYLGHRDCLRLTISQESSWAGRGIRQVVTNRGGWLRTLGSERGGWEVISRYPSDIVPAVASRKPWLMRWGSPQDSQAAPLFALSDQSVLSNGMLWHGDNLLLALRLIEDLSSRGRENVLVIVNGAPIVKPPSVLPSPRDEIPPANDLPTPAVSPTTQEVLDIANTVIAKVEDADLINELLAEQPRRILPPYYRRLMLVTSVGLLTAAAVYFVFLQNQRRTSTQSVYMDASTLQGKPAPRQHKSAMKSPEERGMVAQVLIRDTFTRWTGSDDVEVWKHRIDQVEHQIDAPIPSSARHLLHLASMENIPPLSKEKLLAIGRDLLAWRAHVANRR